jgi:hypothetical protein
MAKLSQPRIRFNFLKFIRRAKFSYCFGWHEFKAFLRTPVKKQIN